MMHHKIVIANSKDEDCGKSASVRFAFAELSTRYEYKVLDPENGIFDATKDVKAIVFIPQADGHIVKVGIESYGDPKPSLRQGESIKEFVDKGCEIILVACRETGYTKNNVTNLQKNGWQLIWFDNSTLRVDKKNNIHDESGTQLDQQNDWLQIKLSRDYGLHAASLIERLVLNEGEIRYSSNDEVNKLI